MLILLLGVVFVLNVVLAATNRTIDDTLGDSVTGSRPKYSPVPGVWEDATCKGCAIQPDPSLAFDGTWTAATYNPNISTSIELNFKGTAIYVFFILANNVAPGITTVTECNFTVDGLPRGNFVHQPDMTNFNLQYNQMVFSITDLLNIDHTLLIATSGVDHNVFINFDYANYTVPDDPVPTTSSFPTTSPAGQSTPTTGAAASITPLGATEQSDSTPAGAIAGIVIGILVALAILVALLFYWHRQRQRRRVSTYSGSDQINHSVRRTGFDIDPFPTYQAAMAARSSLYQHSMATGGSHWTGASGGDSELYTSESLPIRPTHQRQDTQFSFSQYSQPSALPTVTRRLSAAYGGVPAQSIDEEDERPLPPLPPQSPSPPADPAAIRQARQLELENQMRRIKQELRELNNEAAGRRASLASSPGVRVEDDHELRELREQIRLMRNQMQVLREQAESPWALGLSDVPPPGYEPNSATTG